MNGSPPLQVLFLTGQSDPPRCALAPEQRRFLDALDLPEGARGPLNFPYREGRGPYREVGLAAASLRHVALGLRLLEGSWLRRQRSPVLARLAAARHSLVLAGSIGLEILGRLQAPPGLAARLTVFAYGPVCWHPPACRTLRVVGRRDPFARPWRRRADLLVDCGHLDYLGCPEVLAACRTLLAEVREAAGA